jgi:hypothetical protein
MKMHVSFFACTFPKITEIKIKQIGSHIILLVYYLQMVAKQQNNSHKNCLCNKLNCIWSPIKHTRDKEIEKEDSLSERAYVA